MVIYLIIYINNIFSILYVDSYLSKNNKYTLKFKEKLKL
jgi:hypothetical protein